MRGARGTVGVTLAALLLPAAASAQAYQCRVPQGPVSVPRIEREGPVRQTRVTGYTLALSWSPEFCRFRADSARHARQCGGREGRFGLVVHGLWPEGARGQWPQWCPTDRQPSPRAVAGALCMTPDARTIAHEWARHGSCMVPDPDAYIEVTQILWRSLRLPDLDRLSRQQGLTAGQVRAAFADANRYWEAEDVGLALSNRGWLREIRLCYGADFMPTACDPRRYGPEDEERVSIWRGL